MQNQNPPRGRGSGTNVTGRFNRHQTVLEQDDSFIEEEFQTSLKTQFFIDSSKTIVNENSSPDIPFTYSINAYRGCEHGCAYCFARPTHEYFGLSAGLDFESKIFYKPNAPEQLRERLMKKSWVPETIFMSGATDCYQPAERKFELTRGCLKVLAEFRNPVGIITKNALIARDVDILADMASDNTARATLSITTLNPELARKLEPRTSSPAAKLKAMELLAKAGVPMGVNIAPVIPGLTDQEMPAILKAARDAGATTAGLTLLRLPYSVKDLFAEWLDQHAPDRKDKVLNFIRASRDGKLNDANFGSRFEMKGAIAENIEKMFDLFAGKYGFNKNGRPLATEHFRRPGDQLAFFE